MRRTARASCSRPSQLALPAIRPAVATRREQRPARRGTLLLPAAVALVFGISMPGASPGIDPHEQEQQLLASMVFKLSTFVSWPDDAFPTAGAPVVIGILATPEFAAEVARVAEGRNIDSRQIEIRVIHEPADMAGVHVLYVSGFEGAQLSGVLSIIDGQSVFTIGGAKEFTERGGICLLYKSRDRFRFEINLDAAERAGIYLSAKMLALARITRARR